MIPLRDTIQSRNYPLVNTLIIGVNSGLFLLELGQGRGFNEFIFTYGLVPARYSVPEIGAYFSASQQVVALFSFMFLHGGFWHLLGNMWSLYIFGDNVEDRLGPFRYLVFYLVCGIASGLFHLFIHWHSRVPTIGASGAIAGVMGAYFILYPKSRILTLIPIFFLPYLVEVPAYFFLAIWFLIQFISAASSPAQAAGIAWWAHIGGFLFGLIFLKLLLNIPQIGITRRLRPAIPRGKTHRLQVLRPVGSVDDPHLYGILPISMHEARLGTRKLIRVPGGIHKRLLRVTVPAGVRHGTVLRLAGMGKQIGEAKPGDLMLTVSIRS
jgi:membrane associated rhomboid family serine protease